MSDLEVLGCFANSDHNMIRFNISICTGMSDSQRRCLDYNKANFDVIRDALRGMSWKEDGTIVELWQSFKDQLKQVETLHVPVRTEHKAKKKSPWISNKAIMAVRAKHRKYAKYKNASHPACVRSAGIAKRMRSSKIEFQREISHKYKG